MRNVHDVSSCRQIVCEWIVPCFADQIIAFRCFCLLAGVNEEDLWIVGIVDGNRNGLKKALARVSMHCESCQW